MRLCEIEGCDRKHNAKGLCQMHRVRQRKTGTTEKSNRKPLLCIHCGEDDPSKFNGAYRSRCAACRVEYERQHDIDNPENAYWKSRRANLWKNYRLRLYEYRAMIERQDGKCAICHLPPLTPKTFGDGFAVDHDPSHCPRMLGTNKTCGSCIRALLCGPCNRTLGFVKDDPALLRAAADYIERHAARFASAQPSAA